MAETTDEPPAGLIRMRRLATLLLAAVTGLFAVTFTLEPRWPWLAPVRAFAEAAMVGGIADWFAVVALFRRPLGLPIPHTAVVPRNQSRIASAIGRFVAGNFLASEATAKRLEELDPAGRLGQWLSHGGNMNRVGHRITGILPPLLDIIGEDRVRALAASTGRQAVDLVANGPRMADMLAFMAERGYHHILLDRTLDLVHGLIARNHKFIRAKVSQRCGEWIPLWVETRLADAIIDGLNETLQGCKRPDHPWRIQLDEALQKLIADLATSPAFADRVDTLKQQILTDPAMEQLGDTLWATIHQRVADEGQGLTRRALVAASERLCTDRELRNTVNHWLRLGMERLLIPRRDFLESLIADLVLRWRPDAMVERLEAHVGKDLQYIRINGTVVGGLVGLAIYAVTALAPR
jgi:uncharacterized membrane-anchored protein YjiN (DUF445 family)